MIYFSSCIHRTFNVYIAPPFARRSCFSANRLQPLTRIPCNVCLPFIHSAICVCSPFVKKCVIKNKFTIFYLSKFVPPPLLAASIRAVWKRVVGHGLGTKLSESPITENTIVGVDLTPSFMAFHAFSCSYKVKSSLLF